MCSLRDVSNLREIALNLMNFRACFKAPVSYTHLDVYKRQQQQPNDRTIVVQVLYRPGAPPAYKINETDVAKADLLPKLTEIYANRAERVMFVKGDDDLNFAYVADVIDIGRAANVDHIGLMTPKIQAGQ